MFIYSLLDNARSKQVREEQLPSFDAFVEKYITRPWVRTEKDGLSVCFARFGKRKSSTGGFRWDGNVGAITAFALDIDCGGSEEQIRSLLSGILFVAHTTFTHSTAKPRWRVIMPLRNPVGPEYCRRIFEHFNEMFGGILDASCKNPSRIYFLPACPRERVGLYKYFVGAGEAIDAESIDDGHGGSLAKADVLRTLQGVAQGERDDQLFRLACLLRSSGVPREEAERLVMHAAQNCTPPFSIEEALRKVESAWKYAAEGLATDLANAHRLVHRNRGAIRYLSRLRTWIVWDGIRWKVDYDGEIYRRIRATVLGIYGEAAANPDLAPQILKHAKASQQIRRMEAMEKLARSEDGIPIDPQALDTDPWILGTPTGIVDLRRGAVREPRPSDQITKLTTVSYEPTATCSQWEAFLLQVMAGNRSMVEFLRRAVGYSLTGLTDEQCLFFLYGTGANGKSTLLSVLRHIFGDYAVQSPAEMLVSRRDRGIPNDIARLRGSRLVVTSELEEDDSLAEALVKQLTGGDTLVARFLFGEFFEFSPTFKIWLAANHKPRIRGDDFAIWRRIRLIPFVVEVPSDQQDPNLLSKLLAEADGIFAWAVQGCLDWQQKGLAPPPEVMAASEAYRAEMDTFNLWVDDCCEVAIPIDFSAIAGASALYENYQAWSLRNGARPISPSKFAARLGGRGINKARSRSGVQYIGIRIREGGNESPEM